MESSKFTLAIIQERCMADKNANLKRSLEQIRAAAKNGAQIVCLQEIFSTPYFCTVEDHKFFELAEAVSGETVESMQKLAKELVVVIVVPFFERRAAGLYHNSAAVIDADGALLGVYRKMHIPDDPLYYEKFYFTPGDAEPGFQVFKTRYAKLGVLICWDQWYPEGARLTALQGADLLFYPTAIGWHPGEKEEFGAAQVQAWQTMQRAHAISNGVFVAAANRIGHEATPGTEGIEFFGNSFVYDPFGRILAQASSDKAEILITECDKKLIDQTRTHWPFLRDRRVDAYTKITSRFID